MVLNCMKNYNYYYCAIKYINTYRTNVWWIDYDEWKHSEGFSIAHFNLMDVGWMLECQIQFSYKRIKIKSNV